MGARRRTGPATQTVWDTQVTYKLKYEAALEAVHDALPQAASKPLTLALAAACDDPVGATQPFGHDDVVMRAAVTEQVLALLFIGHNLKTITVLRINYLG